jgi:glycosyltransferase involved in cell wall biosynthesis
MKKVLIFPDFDKFGGTRTHIKNLINYYCLENYMIVTAIDREYCDQDILEYLTKKNIKNIFLSRKYRMGVFSRFYLGIIVDLFLGIPIIIKERPNIVIISTGSPGKFLGLMLLYPLKLIYILHTYPICIRSNLIYRLLLLVSLNTEKRIVTVSKFSRNQIIKCWLAGKKRKFVDYFYNFSILENDSICNKDSRKKDIMKILTVGHVVWYKNPDTWYSVAVKTIQNYNGNLEFLWAGEGDLLEFYREKVKKDNIPQIKFLGYQNNIGELYSQCDIYFQPSRLESHGIAVVDAMQMAIPCIVSNIGGLPESITDGKTGYIINPDNIDEMVLKILNLLGNDSLRGTMGKAAKKFYEKTFSKKRWTMEMNRLNNI